MNKRLADLSLAAEFGAFKQKWATGFELPTDENGQPVEDVKTALTRMMVSDDDKTKFGSFDATDLGPYIESIKQDVLHAAAVSQTPPHHIIGGIINAGADRDCCTDR